MVESVILQPFETKFRNRKIYVFLSAIPQKYVYNRPVDNTWYIFGSGIGLATDLG